MDIGQMVAAGLIQKVVPAKDLAEKEFKEADYDIERAKEALESNDYKWSIVKAYYAVFHSTRGIMFLMGYREKSHFGVGEYLGILSKDGKLESRYVHDFKAAMSARQAADYNYDYSKEKAGMVVSIAEEFLKRMEKLKTRL